MKHLARMNPAEFEAFDAKEARLGNPCGCRDDRYIDRRRSNPTSGGGCDGSGGCGCTACQAREAAVHMQEAARALSRERLSGEARAEIVLSSGERYELVLRRLS